MFAQINEAYTILSDPLERAMFDEFGYDAVTGRMCLSTVKVPARTRDTRDVPGTVACECRWPTSLTTLSDLWAPRPASSVAPGVFNVTSQTGVGGAMVKLQHGSAGTTVDVCRGHPGTSSASGSCSVGLTLPRIAGEHQPLQVHGAVSRQTVFGPVKASVVVPVDPTGACLTVQASRTLSPMIALTSTATVAKEDQSLRLALSRQATFATAELGGEYSLSSRSIVATYLKYAVEISETQKLSTKLSFGAITRLATAYTAKSHLSTLRLLWTVCRDSTGVTLSFARTSQLFIFPFIVKGRPTVRRLALAYGIPVLTLLAARYMIIEPLRLARRRRTITRIKVEQAASLDAMKDEAARAVEVMRSSAEAGASVERARHGLIIEEAFFGPTKALGRRHARSHGVVLSQWPRAIDVTVPLQHMVESSRLLIAGGSTKTAMIGFHDPCFGEGKSIYIRYLFGQREHAVCLRDGDPITLPMESHMIE